MVEKIILPKVLLFGAAPPADGLGVYVRWVVELGQDPSKAREAGDDVGVGCFGAQVRSAPVRRVRAPGSMG